MTGEHRVKASSGRPGRVLTALLCALTAAGLYGCSGSGPRSRRPRRRPPRHRAHRHLSLHRTAREARPVLAVKLDNVPGARPHTGLGKADLVYVEQVEGGFTRLMAVYSSRLPDLTGPVRSARESDIALLGDFGRPVLAYSGAQSALTPLLRAAPLHLVTESTAPGAFQRSPDRPAPHNLYLRPGRALAAAPGPANPGHRLPLRTRPGRRHPVTTSTVRYPAARYTFTWSAADRAWRVAMDGREARATDTGPLTPATVVVQRVTVRPPGSTTGSARSPRTARPSAAAPRSSCATAAPTRPAGPAPRPPPAPPSPPRRSALPFAPGQVWILLAPR
ncbi:DUF3048 domain-containing protein [Streptomyces diastatochromogenes]|nr:DUF3048 domain-containing protein [Streptomyces diastatochromogenes]